MIYVSILHAERVRVGKQIMYYFPLAPPRDLNAVTTDMGYSQDWGVGLGLHSDWGGPVLDHFVTMLATLLLPIK